MAKKTFTTAEKLTIAMVWFYFSSLPIIFSKRDNWICQLAGPGLLDHIHSSIGGGSDPFGQSFSGFFGRQVSDFLPVFFHQIFILFQSGAWWQGENVCRATEVEDFHIGFILKGIGAQNWKGLNLGFCPNFPSLPFRLTRRRIWAKEYSLVLSLSTWRFTHAPRLKTGFLKLSVLLSMNFHMVISMW